MARFKIVTTAGPSTDYSLEMEALAAVDADAIYGKARPRITARVINAAKKLKVVSLASVGVDSVDVDAATALGIPVTKHPPRLLSQGGRPPPQPPPAHR